VIRPTSTRDTKVGFYSGHTVRKEGSLLIYESVINLQIVVCGRRPCTCAVPWISDLREHQYKPSPINSRHGKPPDGSSKARS